MIIYDGKKPEGFPLPALKQFFLFRRFYLGGFLKLLKKSDGFKRLVIMEARFDGNTESRGQYLRYAAAVYSVLNRNTL